MSFVGSCGQCTESPGLHSNIKARVSAKEDRTHFLAVQRKSRLRPYAETAAGLWEQLLTQPIWYEAATMSCIMKGHSGPGYVEPDRPPDSNAAQVSVGHAVTHRETLPAPPRGA